MITCSFCGQENSEGTLLCGICGRSLQSTDVETHDDFEGEIAIAVSQIESGDSRGQILQSLMDRGYSEEVSSRILSLAEKDDGKGPKDESSRARSFMVVGGASLAIGAFMILRSSAADPSFRANILFLVVMAWGAVQLLRGFIKWRKNR